MRSLLQAIATLSLLVVASQSQAIAIKIPGERAGHWDFTLMAANSSGTKFELNDDSEVDTDGNWGWGFSFGYNFDNHWNLGFEMAMNNNSRFSLSERPGLQDDVNGKMDSYRGQVNATYHFLEGSFTPFIVGGIGWQYTDTNVIKSLSNGCVWYPWYGYVCGTFANTYDDTSFSYNFGAGLRWDVTEGIFLRGSYGRQWIQFSKTNGTPYANIGRLELGFMF